jgi:predicted lipid-binding transport protein (Tim44 family)
MLIFFLDAQGTKWQLDPMTPLSHPSRSLPNALAALLRGLSVAVEARRHGWLGFLLAPLLLLASRELRAMTDAFVDLITLLQSDIELPQAAAPVSQAVPAPAAPQAGAARARRARLRQKPAARHQATPGTARSRSGRTSRVAQAASTITRRQRQTLAPSLKLARPRASSKKA